MAELNVPKVSAETISAVTAAWGRLGGATKSPARAKASRENGKLGRRPLGKKGKRKKNPHAVAPGRRGGKIGGLASTPAKRAAARENGKKGGRPKKKPVAELLG